MEATLFGLGNNIKNLTINGHIYGCFVDYNIIDTNNIINIHKYLMKKDDLKQCVFLLKQYSLDCQLVYLIFLIIQNIKS